MFEPILRFHFLSKRKIFLTARSYESPDSYWFPRTFHNFTRLGYKQSWIRLTKTQQDSQRVTCLTCLTRFNKTQQD